MAAGRERQLQEIDSTWSTSALTLPVSETISYGKGASAGRLTAPKKPGRRTGGRSFW